MQTGTPPAAIRPLVGHPAAPPPVWAQICPAGLQYPIRRPSASVTACNFLFRPPFVQPIYRPRPRFCMQAASLALCLQRGPIDDDRLRISAPRGLAEHDPGEVPSSLQRFQCSHSVLAGPYSFGASPHLQPLRLIETMALSTFISPTRGRPWPLRKMEQKRFLRACQPEQPAHDHVPSRSLNHGKA